MSDDQSKKADAGKPHPTYIPWPGVLRVLDVLEFGARKYAPRSWALVKDARARYAEALGRHAIEFLDRYPKEGVLHADTESGLPVIAHLACNALFLLALGDEMK